MGVGELRAAGERLLAEARAVRAAFPDAAAMRQVPAGEDAADGSGGGEGTEFRAAVGYLCAEIAVVCAGKAADLTVLDDEMANVERAMPRA